MNTGGFSSLPQKINLEVMPRQVRDILDRLRFHNFTAYLVGGAVRDMIMGREPKDYDVATSATPGEIREIFERVVPTGERHGTVTVLLGGLGVEVTTLRRDGKYSDHRRPDTVEFTRSLKDDLSRRDFTINSLAAGPDGRITDFFGGLRDISAGFIRAVGSPGKRFREDALRMLRAIRFGCQTGFSIEEKTLGSIRSNRRLITRVSMERIREELNAILLSGLPDRGTDLLFDCGLLEYIVPELSDWVQAVSEAGGKDAAAFVAGVLRRTPARLNVRLAALLHGLGGEECTNFREWQNRRRPEDNVPQVRVVLDRLKYDRRTAASVTALVENRCIIRLYADRKEIKKVLGRVGRENTEDLFALLEAEAAESPGFNREYSFRMLREAAGEIINNNEPLRVKDLALNGNDLKAMGIKPGREMGRILDSLLEVVLDRPGMNEKNLLMDIARRWKNDKIRSPESGI